MAEFHIGDHSVGPGEPTFIIAEAGSNHNGDLETAKELIDVAADAGADAVKFQTFRAKDLYVDDRELAEDEESIYELLERLEQPYDWIPKLHNYCQRRDILFMSSPFDKQSARELAEYVPAFKIASFTLSHQPLIEDLASYGKPVIMSTGAHERSNIEEAVGVLRANGVDDIALLHCVSSYPTPLEEINVSAVETLEAEFDTVAGFSDHTTDPVTAPAAAVALGAAVVEKHFTLDKQMDGPDHSFSLEPDELRRMVDSIRATESALGDGSLGLRAVESGSADRGVRSIFAVEDIAPGETITEDLVEILRPGNLDRDGAHPKFISDIVGATATTAIQDGDPVSFDQISTDSD